MLAAFPLEKIAVGIGTMAPAGTCSAVSGLLTGNYGWTQSSLKNFLGWISSHGIVKLAIWRADIAALLYKQPHYCGVEPWMLAQFASFLSNSTPTPNRTDVAPPLAWRARPPSQQLRPCDIFQRGGTACVAAHSTVRALYASYAGPLYTVKRIGNDGCSGATASKTPQRSGMNASDHAVCGCTPDGKSVHLACPKAGRIIAVTFATIGTPTGACGALVPGKCRGDPAKAQAAVAKLCVGQTNCTIVADIQHMNGGQDPCVGIPKSIAVEVQCSTLVSPEHDDGKTLDVFVKQPGGYANSAAQDSFCAHARCIFTKIYDQSSNGNHLQYIAAKPWTMPANAARDPLTVGGHKVYGLRMGGDGDHPDANGGDPPSAYRCDNATKVAVGDEAETICEPCSPGLYLSMSCLQRAHATHSWLLAECRRGAERFAL